VPVGGATRFDQPFELGRLGFVVAILIGLVTLACTTSPPGGSGGAMPPSRTGPNATAIGGSIPPHPDGETKPVGAPVDFAKRGPYAVGVLRLAIGNSQVVVYYPAEDAAIGDAQHVTSYSWGEAFSPELRAFVAGLAPELIQDVPIDAYADVRINHEGPFPVIVHSHGDGGYFLFASQHFSHEASWGYVVAAPDHGSRDLAAVATAPPTVEGDTDPEASPDGDRDVADLSNTLDLLARENAAVDSPIMGGLDTQLVGAEGHAAGGWASYLFAANEPRVKVWIGQAPLTPIGSDATNATNATNAIDEPLPPEPLPPEQQLDALRAALAKAPVLEKPAMIVTGEKDTVLPLAAARVAYDRLSSPARLVVVKNAGHGGFVDACKAIRERGGRQKYAELLPSLARVLERGDDGCGAGNVDPVKVTGFVNHVMVAQYRVAFGQDRTDASLRPDYLARTFPEAFGEALDK